MSSISFAIVGLLGVSRVAGLWRGESLLVGLYQYQLYKVGHCRVGRWGHRAPVGHCCLWFLGVLLVLFLVFFDNLGVGSALFCRRVGMA